MRTLLLSALLAGTAALAGLPTQRAAAATNCEMHMVASIPAKLSPANQLLLDVSVNDTPATIEVDTGAAVSMLSQKFAVRTGMPIENMPGVIYGLSGEALNQKTHVRSLRLGNAVSSNEPLVLTPVLGDGTDGGPIGLFGADYLQNYDIEIDVAGGKLNLFTPEHCPGQVVYWAADYFKSRLYYPDNSILHRPTMDIAVDGKNMHALIDTGASMTVMRMAVARDRFDLSPDSPDMQPLGTTKGVEGRALQAYMHTFQSLTFGDITLHNTRVAIVPINTAAHVETTGSHLKQAAAEEPDVLIGMSLLKQLHLFIAYSENALYYTVGQPKQAAGQ